MTSCGGTFMATVCRLTLRMRSIPNGRMKKTPGPFGDLSTLPTRKMTARSYSCSTRTIVANAATTRTSRTRKMTMTMPPTFVSSRLAPRQIPAGRCGISLSYVKSGALGLWGGPSRAQTPARGTDRGRVLRADLEDAIVDRVDADALPGRQQAAAGQLGAPDRALDHHDPTRV